MSILNFIVIFWTLNICVYYAEAGFRREPGDLNATINSTIRWQCSADTHRVYWKVNGTNVHELSLQFSTSSVSSNGVTDVHLDANRATVAYNNSRVQCVIQLTSLPASDGGEELHSNVALLTLQGLLEVVGDLQAHSSMNSIKLSWISPFSLDITDTTPDLWYSVEISGRAQLQSPPVQTTCEMCSYITETEFTFTDNSYPCGVYDFTVIAINAAGQGKGGTNSTIRSFFLKELDEATTQSVDISESSHCSYEILIEYNFPLCPGAVPETYRVIIHNTNNSTRPPLVYGPSEVLLVSQGIQGEVYASNLHFTATLLLITHKLFSGEKYSLQIEAQNTLGRRNTTNTITIETPNELAQLADAEAYIDDGRLCITCKFNPSLSAVMQNCTALIFTNMIIVLRIAWGKFVHSSTTECFDTIIEVGESYTLRVFSGWDAQCSQAQDYPVFSLQVEAPAPEAPTNVSYSSSDKFHCSTQCVVGIVAAAITTIAVVSTVLLFGIICAAWRKNRQDCELGDDVGLSITTHPSVAYQQPVAALKQHLPLTPEEPIYSEVGPS